MDNDLREWVGGVLLLYCMLAGAIFFSHCKFWASSALQDCQYLVDMTGLWV